MLKVLAEPHKGHHKNNALHGDRHKGHEVRYLRHNTHGGHRAIKHAVATGAQRETVPSPVQDFVLVSGSPLFHERPRASDSKPNATLSTTQEAKDQKAPQLTQGNNTAANQTLAKVLGQGPLSSQTTETTQQKQEPSSFTDTSGTGQVHGNGTQQQSLQESAASSKPSPAFVQELAQKIKESLDKGKDQGKKENGTQSSTPAVSITLKTPGKTNASSGIVIGLENKPLTNAEQGKPSGQNASVKVVKLLVTGQNTNSSSLATNGRKGNQTSTTTAADMKPENKNPSVGNFPFNLPGIRNVGNETNDNKGAELTNQMTEKDKKLGLHENLGPNCHWKTTKGANGAVITSVACSGEFHRQEGSKGGLDEAVKKPHPGDASKVGPKESSSKQLSAENASVSETGEGEKEIHMQSKSGRELLIYR